MNATDNEMTNRLSGSFPRVAGLRALIIGMGESGIAAANLLLHEGAKVLVYDADSKKEKSLRKTWEPRGVTVLSGVIEPMQGFDFCVISPGVPPFGPFFTWLVQAGIPLLGEMELACRFIRRPIIAVTGTNGKTTVVNMIAHILRACGQNPSLAGNVGFPVARIALEEERQSNRPLVLEVSSFQCETFSEFKANITVITNLAPDHLDRYPSAQKYYATKFKIAMNQTSNDVLWMGSRVEGDCPDWVLSTKKSFSIESIEPSGIFYENGTVIVRDDSKDERVLWPSFQTKLPQYIQNALVSTGAVSSMGISVTEALQSLESFIPLPHRLEYVDEVNGIKCYNDSKATNVHALEAALCSIPAPILLVAGGRAKGDSLAPLDPLIREKVRMIYLIGEAKEEFAKTWRPITTVVLEETLEDAVTHALQSGKPGDNLLLSPACASWDMFANYKERGECFRKTVQQCKK